MAEQAGGDLRRQQHRQFGGVGDFRAQPRQRALAGPLTDLLGGGQQIRAAAGVVPEITLHALVVLGHHRATARVHGAGVALQKAGTGAQHPQAAAGGHRGALGVDDALVVAGHRFAAQGVVDGLLGAQRPGVVQVQVRYPVGQLLGAGDAGVLVLFGVAGDGAGGGHRVAQTLRAVVGGGRLTLALAEEHRHRQAPVAVKFHRLHLAQTDVHGQPLGQAQLGFGGAGALAFRLFQHLCHGVAGGPQMLRAEIRCHAGVFGHKIRFPFNALLEALLPWNHDRV